MRMNSYYLVYPEGDLQEIDAPLSFDEIVGLNGMPIRLPLATARTLAYRVYRINRKEERGETAHFYFLEQIVGRELESLAY